MVLRIIANNFTANGLRGLGLITLWLGLMLAGVHLQAAGTAEDKAYERVRADLSKYTDPNRAETASASFLKNHPTSEHFADVALIEAQALYKQQKYTNMIELLSTPQIQAVKGVADQFTYWMAEAQYYLSNYHDAAETFARLVKDYPASTRRLDAAVEEADARVQMADWPHVVEKLGPSDGVFQQIARTNLTDPRVVRGLFILTEAELAQKDYAAAERSLQSLAAQKLGPEQEWGRQYLLCRILAGRDAEKAWQSSANLLEAAAGRPDFQAEGVLLQGGILEQLDRLPEAIQVYQTNLDGDLPVWRKQQALLKIVTLSLRLGQTTAAAQKLEDFLTKHPEQKGSDFELLALGELRLKEAMTPGGATNSLEQAQAAFGKLINTYTNSELFGKAQLNLGWCLWAEGKIPESETAFSNAVERLPNLSATALMKLADALHQTNDIAGAVTNQPYLGGQYEDMAVAIFKLGDALYQQKKYAAAVTNYQRIIDQYGSLTAVRNELFEQALYQIARASVAQTNLPAATDAMNKILKWFPNSALGAPGMLLVGQALNREGGPAEARQVFSDFIARFPVQPLLPEVKLAIARTYEKETNWSAAITQYDAWVAAYTNSSVLPRAEFSRAWVNYEAGNDTNAMMLFTNFVMRFQTNQIATNEDLAASAQYWVGDFYWRRENYIDAELNYQKVFQKWPGSRLSYQAYMMAGRAAMERANPVEASSYFTNLTACLSVSNSSCPKDLALQALFALGDASMALPDTNPSKYKEAIANFLWIANTYTNSRFAPLAWGRLGDCYHAIAPNDPVQYEAGANDYQLSTNSYQKAIDSDLADAATRGMAECGLAQSLEGRARLEPADRQGFWLRQAVERYLNVLQGSSLRDNEEPDTFWSKEAGMAAGRLDEELGEWDKAVSLYQSLMEELPPLPTLQNSLEKKIANAKAQKQKRALENN
jgi:TolA-binding protein